MGAPHITWVDEPLQTDTKKAIALLVYLAMSPTTHTRDHLASLLWTSPEPARNKAALRRTLSTLRKALHDDEMVLHADRKTISLPPTHADVDARRFLSLLTPSNEAPPPQEKLQAALAMYQGPFLEGFYLQESTPFEGWCAEISQSLQASYRQALLWGMDAAEADADWAQAIHLAQQALQIDALDEPMYQRLIRYLVANGQRADALEQYEVCRQHLAEGLNIKPSAQTKALLQQLQQPEETASKEAQEVPPELEVASPDTSGSSPQISIESPLAVEGIPTLAPLFGRGDDLSTLVEQLASPSCQWLTIKGPVGCGKSHLARHLAIQREQPVTAYLDLKARHPDDIEPQQLFSQIEDAASALRQRAPAQPGNDATKPSHRLIIDHFPSTLCNADAWRQFDQRWPSIQRVLVSRQQANVRGEWLYELDEIPFGDGNADWREAPAPALLQWYARRHRQDIALQPEDRSAVEALYGLLGGHPLGLQMAAEWLRVLSPDALLEELQRDLSALELPQTYGPGTHATWQALFQDVWSTLTDDAREACRATVKNHHTTGTGGWIDTDEWLDLTGASLPLLLSLRDQGWMRRNEQEQVALWQLMASSIAQWER